MVKILKNNTAQVVPIDDIHIDLPASSDYTIPEERYIRFASSSDVIAKLADGTLTYNDGSSDLNLSDAITALKGLYPTAMHIDTTYANNKPIVRAESRPDGTATYFTTRGDSVSNIGDGLRLEWDFANTDNDDPSPPTNFKRKIIDITFIDPVYIKEGTMYFHSVPKGCTANFMVLCPDGAAYLDRDGAPQVASGDVIVDHYVVDHPLQGSVPMGDELNTETANINAAPAGYIFRIEVTTPDSDVTSNGVIELEMFRSRSILLPNESI